MDFNFFARLRSCEFFTRFCDVIHISTPATILVSFMFLFVGNVVGIEMRVTWRKHAKNSLLQSLAAMGITWLIYLFFVVGKLNKIKINKIFFFLYIWTLKCRFLLKYRWRHKFMYCRHAQSYFKSRLLLLAIFKQFYFCFIWNKIRRDFIYFFITKGQI